MISINSLFKKSKVPDSSLIDIKEKMELLQSKVDDKASKFKSVIGSSHEKLLENHELREIRQKIEEYQTLILKYKQINDLLHESTKHYINEFIDEELKSEISNLDASDLEKEFHHVVQLVSPFILSDRDLHLKYFHLCDSMRSLPGQEYPGMSTIHISTGTTSTMGKSTLSVKESIFHKLLSLMYKNI